ncbi:MAG: NAD(+) diphosphatase [Lachnospiraceae bacterium]|nr:NAD(+) diphosphatase [Lachnospiraceae bacterium]
MIQDIAPSRLDNSFRKLNPKTGETILFFDRDGKMLVNIENGRIHFPKWDGLLDVHTIYLFSIDEERFFLATDKEDHLKDGFVYMTIREIRSAGSGTEVYAAFTGYHLWKWYADNRFCGKCGKRLDFDDKERAMRCPECGNVIYPRINPAVIVGVTKGDCLLIAKYRTGYGGNALVAGFTEIGETLEETVAREVMEETGVSVKNIRYYKSQPWGMAQDILVGFFCDADGKAEIRIDESELKYAEWVRCGDIVLQENNLSLTNEMMMVFKEMGRYENSY